MKHIVLMGGGSWISHLMPAFSAEPDWKVSAIIATGDSGGSTGVIRESYSLPALGDIVKNLAALGGDETQWMTYRYDKGFLAGHTPGNLWLLGLIQIYGFSEWVKKAHEILWHNLHRIIPVAYSPHDIKVTTKNGEIILWEGPIIQYHHLSHNIAQIELTPSVEASPEAIEAIKWADCIIIWPGTLYTSLIACLLPRGIREAIHTSKAKKCYIANAANFPPWHCERYALSDYLVEIKRFTGIEEFDGILGHDGSGIPKTQRIEILWDEKNIQRENILTTPTENTGGIYDSIKRNTLRHDGKKVVQWIKKFFD